MDKNDPRAKRTRQMFEDAFTELIQKKNAESVTVKELVETAGLSRATFYLHYEDMPSFIVTLTDNMIKDLILYSVNDTQSSVIDNKDYYKRYFDYIFKHQDLFREMLGPHGCAYFRHKFVQEGVRGYEQQLRPYIDRFERNVSLDMLSNYIASAHTGITEYWLNGGCKYSSRYMAKQIQYLTIEGLRPIAELKDILILPR